MEKSGVRLQVGSDRLPPDPSSKASNGVIYTIKLLRFKDSNFELPRPQENREYTHAERLSDRVVGSMAELTSPRE